MREPVNVFHPLKLIGKVNLKGDFRVWPRAYLKKNLCVYPYRRGSPYKISYCSFLLKNTLIFTTNTDAGY